MKLLIKTTLLLIIFSLGSAAPAMENCPSFRHCYNQAKTAQQNGKLSEAYQYYANTCAMDVKRQFIGFRFDSCNQVIKISKEVDEYSSAMNFFGDSCDQGNSNGCFFLGKLEENKGNLRKAIEIMEPLCKDGFSNKGVYGYNGCDALKFLKLKWDRENPPPPKQYRKGAAALYSFLAVFVFPSISIFLMRISNIKRNKNFNTIAIGSTLLGFLVYVYYESGISPYAAIRVDLLLILPLLVLNLVLLIRSIINKTKKEY